MEIERFFCVLGPLGKIKVSWPTVTPVWIHLKGILYHCRSSDILLSIVGSTGKPLHLDETMATQRMLSYARVLVNLDVTKSGPNSLTLEPEEDATVEVEVQYENVPCFDCHSASHLSA